MFRLELIDLIGSIQRHPTVPLMFGAIWSDASCAPFRHTFASFALPCTLSILAIDVGNEKPIKEIYHRWYPDVRELLGVSTGTSTADDIFIKLSSCESGLIARHRHRRLRRNPLRKAGTGTERHEPDQQLISAKDVPRTSRHVEVRWFWMRELIQRGRVRLKFKEGSIYLC